MPARKPTTKKAKRKAVKQVMHEYKHGQLRSGSKKGPKVKNRRQAVAIAMREAGMPKKGKKK